MITEKIERFNVTIQGTTKLVVHNFLEVTHRPSIPPLFFLDEHGRECLPAIEIKRSFTVAATLFEELTSAKAMRGMFVSRHNRWGASRGRGFGLIPIEGLDGTPAHGVVREHPITVFNFSGRKRTHVVKGGEYDEWQMRFILEIDPRWVNKEQLPELIRQAGWGTGIGVGRPQKSSLGWGRFELVLCRQIAGSKKKRCGVTPAAMGRPVRRERMG